GGFGALADTAVISPILMTATATGAPDPIVTPASTWTNLTSAVTVPRATLVGQGTVPPNTPGPNDDFRLSFPQSNTTWSDLSIVYIDTSNPAIVDFNGFPGAGPFEPALYAALGKGSGGASNAVYRN